MRQTSALQLNQVGLNVILSPMAGNKRVRALSSMSNKSDAFFLEQ